jgi:hypothetical protein
MRRVAAADYHHHELPRRRSDQQARVGAGQRREKSDHQASRDIHEHRAVRKRAAGERGNHSRKKYRPIPPSALPIAIRKYASAQEPPDTYPAADCAKWPSFAESVHNQMKIDESGVRMPTRSFQLVVASASPPPPPPPKVTPRCRRYRRDSPARALAVLFRAAASARPRSGATCARPPPGCLRRSHHLSSCCGSRISPRP